MLQGVPDLCSEQARVLAEAGRLHHVAGPHMTVFTAFITDQNSFRWTKRSQNMSIDHPTRCLRQIRDNIAAADLLALDVYDTAFKKRQVGI